MRLRQEGLRPAVVRAERAEDESYLAAREVKELRRMP
jgi:hypothetical protein